MNVLTTNHWGSALLAGTMALAHGVESHAQSQQVRARITGYEPALVSTEGTTDIKVNVENTGVGGIGFQLRVTDVPSAWSAGDPSPSSLPLNHGDDGDFTFALTPRLAEMQALVEVELWAPDEFGDLFRLQQTGLFIEAIDPPGTFQIQQPVTDQTLTGQFTVSWTSSLGADTYTLTLEQLQQDGNTLVHTAPGLVDNRYTYNTSELQPGQRYQVQVVAANRVAERAALNGPVRFLTAEVPQLGAFAITAPALSATVSPAPVFEWTASTNAASYTVNVLPEIDGVPVSDPVLRREGLQATFFQWDTDPLPAGRFYYLTVEARNAGGGRFNEGGPRRFFVTQLAPFSLVEPFAGQETVNRESPLFRWERVPGATEYILTIEEAAFEGAPVAQVTVPQQSGEQVPGEPAVTIPYFLEPGRNLRPDTAYTWKAEAVAAGERRTNEGGPQPFRTHALKAFFPFYPVEGEMGVPQEPVFRWEDDQPEGTLYAVDLLPDDGAGQPDFAVPVERRDTILTTEWRSRFPDLPLGSTWHWRALAYTQLAPIGFQSMIGDWQKFTVTPFSESALVPLISPADGATSVPVDTELVWGAVDGATTYTVHLTIPGFGGVQEVTVNAPPADLAELGRHLNGSTVYEWQVEAIAPGTSIFSETRTFTTLPREQAAPRDVLDHLLSRQRLSADEAESLGLEAPVDAASWRRLVE